MKIGCEPFSGECQFNGLMDDLRIYNYPLSETEVAALYSGQATPIQVAAQTEVMPESTQEIETSSNWLPVSVVIAVVIGAVALVARKRKSTA